MGKFRAEKPTGGFDPGAKSDFARRKKGNSSLRSDRLRRRKNETEKWGRRIRKKESNVFILKRLLCAIRSEKYVSSGIRSSLIIRLNQKKWIKLLCWPKLNRSILDIMEKEESQGVEEHILSLLRAMNRCNGYNDEYWRTAFLIGLDLIHRCDSTQFLTKYALRLLFEMMTSIVDFDGEMRGLPDDVIDDEQTVAFLCSHIGFPELNQSISALMYNLLSRAEYVTDIMQWTPLLETAFLTMQASELCGLTSMKSFATIVYESPALLHRISTAVQTRTGDWQPDEFGYCCAIAAHLLELALSRPPPLLQEMLELGLLACADDKGSTELWSPWESARTFGSVLEQCPQWMPYFLSISSAVLRNHMAAEGIFFSPQVNGVGIDQTAPNEKKLREIIPSPYCDSVVRTLAGKGNYTPVTLFRVLGLAMHEERQREKWAAEDPDDRTARISKLRKANEESRGAAFARECPVCMLEAPTARAVLISCGHLTCLSCAAAMGHPGGSLLCPTCRGMTTYVMLQEEEDGVEETTAVRSLDLVSESESEDSVKSSSGDPWPVDVIDTLQGAIGSSVEVVHQVLGEAIGRAGGWTAEENAVKVAENNEQTSRRFTRTCRVCLVAHPVDRVAFAACGHMACRACADSLPRGRGSSSDRVSCPVCCSSTFYVRIFEVVQQLA